MFKKERHEREKMVDKEINKRQKEEDREGRC
jgi:hypothetical protein